MAVVTRMDEKPEGWGEYCRSIHVQGPLKLKAEEFVEIAKGVFLSRQQGEEEAPVFYMSSFYIQREPVLVDGVVPPQPAYQYRVGNTDDIANLVEFGAHAGGDHKTPILHYRVFGRTMDIMEAKS